MYECPNCAGNLKFDIARQQLYCEYCGTQADPYSFEKERDAEETRVSSGRYEVTIFTCPQCGGELISEDTTAATFCSFCGASTILDSRISRKKRPDFIIPFTRTKEDCRNAYKKMLRRAVFAPKELKDEKHIEKFRGIYMPYWVYSFERKGLMSFPGKQTCRSGDYLITDHYELNCHAEEEYRGLAYDASSTFSDSLSGAIAPFDMRQGKAFAPSFLSGFYADTSDVKKQVYLQEAEDIVVQDVARILEGDPICRKYHAGEERTFEWALKPAKQTVQLAMLPVWFLSYRNGDRVSYAVVNGQTGKAAADLPVDLKKYLAGSLLLALPLFLLLNLFLTVTPGKVLMIAVLLAVLCIFISNAQLSHILARESGENDRGLAAARGMLREYNARHKKRKPVRISWNGSIMSITMIAWIGLQIVAIGGLKEMVIAILPILLPAIMFYAVFHIGLGRGDSGKKLSYGGHFKEKWPVLIKPFIGIMFALVILVMKPVSDWFYYIGAFGCMGMLLWAIMDIIRQHNMLTTRKLPQLGRRGGDELE
ncbi:MAG: zinc ribbon domain-containing protein [Lachnospiraceae bacterium]|nr:zinc ribbon domain-containing protein [Lachnospiraceae bacterium]